MSVRRGFALGDQHAVCIESRLIADYDDTVKGERTAVMKTIESIDSDLITLKEEIAKLQARGMHSLEVGASLVSLGRGRRAIADAVGHAEDSEPIGAPGRGRSLISSVRSLGSRFGSSPNA
jgi:hypothetical protein